MDPPSRESLAQALELLLHLEAVDKPRTDSGELSLTPLGKKLAHFPLEPVFAKAILAAQDYGCTHEVLTVVSMLSVDSVLFTPQKKREEAMAARKKFLSVDGDHMMLLSIYRGYKGARGNKVSKYMYECMYHSGHRLVKEINLQNFHVNLQGCAQDDLSGGYHLRVAEIEQLCIKCGISALVMLRWWCKTS